MLRALAQAVLAADNWPDKLALLATIRRDTALDVDWRGFAREPLPCMPSRPRLTASQKVAARGVGTVEGRAALLHAIAHIEANAIHLALDIVWRFPGCPAAFYYDWLQVAHEEAHHFNLINQRLQELGYSYGDFPAHQGLWEMAEKTADDLIARLAMVPCTLEARGLDVTPRMQAKLRQAGDRASADLLQIILDDEIGHVALGWRWFRYVCAQQSLEPLATYRAMAKRCAAPKLKEPINYDARRAAGLSDHDITYLLGSGESATKNYSTKLALC